MIQDVFLHHPDRDKPFVLETDASGYAWGSVLSQPGPDGKMRPVACNSKGFTQTEVEWPTHERELVAIIRALQAQRHWLSGTKEPVTIITDHNNLKYFKDKQILSAKQAGWADTLSQFNFELRYRPGRQNAVADHLSRREDHHQEFPPIERVLLPPELFPDEQRIAAVSHDPPFDLSKEIYYQQSQDPLILKFNTTTEKDNSSIPEGWSLIQDLWCYRGKIYIPPPLQQHVFRLLHSSPSAAHPGRDATLSNIQKDYYWPSLRNNVEEWIRNCDLCQRMKIRPKKKHGFLKPIDVNPGLWEVVTSDLITGLPSCKGYDAIWTATDKGGKLKHLAPTTSTLDSKGLYHLYLNHVWKLHGTSKKLITDHGPQYSSHFAAEMNKNLGIEMALSTAYHPQTDGQSERTNQEVEQALRTVVSFHQDDWVDWLPVIEFALNNRFHKSLGTTPFYANYGYHPQIGSLPRITTPIDSVEAFVSHLQQVQKDTGKALEQAAEDMKKFYDRHRIQAPEFELGQQVLLDNTHLSLNRPLRKLSEKRSGPFKIIQKVGTHTYRLELPQQWKNVHPVFHVSKLEPYHEDPSHPNHPRPPPDIIEGELEWEVEKILDSKYAHQRLMYLVKWYDWPESENSWQDETDLENSQELVSEFHRTHPNAPRRLPDGNVSGSSLTKKRRCPLRKTQIKTLEFRPLENFTDVSSWPSGSLSRDVTF